MTVTPEGIVIERFPEVLAGVEEKQRELINPNIVNRDDEILSEMNVIMSEQIARANAFIEAVRDCSDIMRAEGTALDNLLTLKKIYRINASRSFTTQQIFTGNNGVIVRSGRVIRSSTTGKDFTVVGDVTISTASCLSAVFEAIVQNSSVYTVVIDGNIYTYTSDGTATLSEILTGLNDEFEANPATGIVASAVGDDSGGIISVATLSVDSAARVTIATSSNITSTSVTTSGTIRAVDYGAVIAPAGTVSTLVIPLTGLESTYNEEAVSVGRLKETDQEFRLRGIQTLSTTGTGTVPVIESSLINNITGVSAATVTENDTHLPVDDLPPHSYKVVVVGGDDEEVGRDIWRTKPSGIMTVGSEEIIFADEDGVFRTVYFTRPAPVILALRVTYTLYPEEVTPLSLNPAIRTAVLDYINSLGIGKDVIPNRVEGKIYDAVSGLDEALVEVQVISSSGDTPVSLDWDSSRLSIDSDEYANLVSADIYIVEA